jgi:ATP-dependent Lon protease
MTQPLPEDLAEAFENLPLFPLQQAVLFPGVLLPLHIFEPRYVQLVKAALASHRALSICYVSEPHADMSGNPPVAEIAGAGTIVEQMELPGGRYHILLVGRARVRLQELPFEPPFRRARATLLRSGEDDVPAVELAALHAAATSFAGRLQQRDPDFQLRLPRNPSAGVLADACAHALVLDARERQQILETLNPLRRVQRVTEAIAVQGAALEPPGMMH